MRAGLLGAAAVRLAVPPQWHFAAVVPLTALPVLLRLGRFDDAPQRSGGSEAAAHRFARPTMAVMGLVLLSAALVSTPQTASSDGTPSTSSQ